MITVHLDRAAEIKQIKLGGYIGEPNTWYASNGVGAKILASQDNLTWTEVGVVPQGFGPSIITIDIKPTKAKYFQIQHNNYLGIGYFKAEVGSSSSQNIPIGVVNSDHPSFNNFWFQGPYSFNGRTAGTNKLANVADRSLKQGK